MNKTQLAARGRCKYAEYDHYFWEYMCLKTGEPCWVACEKCALKRQKGGGKKRYIRRLQRFCSFLK